MEEQQNSFKDSFLAAVLDQMVCNKHTVSIGLQSGVTPA